MSNNDRDAHQQSQQQRSAGSQRNTPVPWDSQPPERPNSRGSDYNRDAKDAPSQREREREYKEREAREQQRERIEKYGGTNRQYHSRNESSHTGGSDDYTEPHSSNRQPHIYDIQSMETALSSPRMSVTKNPIPSPSVTVRSEFPTLTRSRQQQSLTCLVTIEAPEGKWRPDPADLRGAPSLPPIQQEQNYNRPKSPAQSHQTADWQTESPEALEEITEDLRVRVDNWHGLDFAR